MLPAMCRNEPCMNIEVKTVSQTGSGFWAPIPFAFSSPAVADNPERLRPADRLASHRCAVHARMRERVRDRSELHHLLRIRAAEERPPVPDREQVRRRR